MSNKFTMMFERSQRSLTSLAGLLVALFLISSASFAHAQSCQDLFSSESSYSRSFAESLLLPSRVLSEHDRSEIRAVLNDKSLMGRDRWTSALEIYLEARLRTVPPGSRAFIKRQVQKLQPRFEPINKIETNSNAVIFPPSFIDTPLPYIVMAHEWEHLIQALKRTGGSNTDGTLNYTFNPVGMYKEEGIAMSAEWELAGFMTDEEAAELDAVVAQTTEGKGFKRFVRGIVDNRLLEREAYVRAIRDTGRYSFLNAIRKTGTNATLFVAAPGAYLSGFCGFIYWIFN